MAEGHQPVAEHHQPSTGARNLGHIATRISSVNQNSIIWSSFEFDKSVVFTSCCLLSVSSSRLARRQVKRSLSNILYFFRKMAVTENIETCLNHFFI